MRATFIDEGLQQEFLQKGYIKLPLITSEEADSLLQYYKSLPSDIEGHAFHSTLRSSDSDYRKKIDERIQEVIRPKIDSLLEKHKLLFANYLVKEANANSEVGVHQDWRFVDESRYRAVVIWCTLTDTNPLNGPLHVLEGSHRLKTPLTFRFAPNLDDRLNNLVKKKSTVVYASKGEAILYDSAIFHFSPPNQTESDRVALGLVAIPEEAKPLHYYNRDGGDVMEEYETGEAFYHKYVIGQPPVEVSLLQKVKVDKTFFTERDVLQLSGSSQSFLGKIFSRIGLR